MQKKYFYNILSITLYYYFSTIKTGVEQLTIGMCSENLGDGIVNKFNSVENLLKEHLPLSFKHMKLKELSAEKRWKDFYLIKL